MPLGIGAAGGISNAGGTKGLSKDPGGGNKGGLGNSRAGGKGGPDKKSNRKTLLTGVTGDTPMSEELEIDPVTGEVVRFDPNRKKKRRTVMDLDGTPTLDELRNAQKALLGY